MKISIFTLAMIFFGSTASAACTFKIKEGTEKLTWTGYKYTKRAAVSGTFKRISFKQTEADSLQNLLRSISFEVATDSLDSGNSARDATLKTTVFNLLKIPGKITGVVKGVKDSVASVIMTFNQEMEVPFEILTEKGANNFLIRATLDLTKNGLKPNYEAVHNTCEKLHTGEDGVSKTWANVDLKVEASFEKSCGILDRLKSWFN